MKKLLSLLAAFALVFTLAGCGDKEEGPKEPTEKGYELALVTDVGTIDDRSFNQGAWEGLKKYAEENNITHKYYQPAEQNDAEYLSAIDLAVKGGAKLIVCPGFLFETAVYEAQSKYPDVKFILIDGTPHNADFTDFVTKENVVGITYAEQEAGFLAGYALVFDGLKDFGFIGGMAVPAVQRFGIGYLQGIDLAAKELGINNIRIKYNYAGAFNPSPEAKALASSWYNDGVEVIFAAAGGLGGSVMQAAGELEKMTVGVDVDQSNLSDTVVTSAVKKLSVAVYDNIKAMYDGKFPGGQNLVYNLTMNGVELPMSSSKFANFSQESYDTLVKRILDGDIKISDDITNAGTKEGLQAFAPNCTVEFIG